MTHTTDDLAGALAQLEHRPGCPRPLHYLLMGHLGDEMAGCRSCGTAVPVARLLAQCSEASRPGRRYVLTCVRCDRDIPVSSSKPRIPLCARCSTTKKRRDPNNWPVVAQQEGK